MSASHYVHVNSDKMRDPDGTEGGQAMQIPQRLYERLAQISGYTWDQSIQPFHSVRKTTLGKDVFTDFRDGRLTTIGMSLVLSI